MENIEKLKGLILETINGGMTAIKEETEKIKDEVGALKEDLTKIKETPVKKVTITGQNDGKQREYLYKDHVLPVQGKGLEHIDSFKIMDVELRDAIAKMMIDMVEAGLNGKREFKADTTMVAGTAGRGGYLVFDEYMNVIRSLGELYGVMLANAEVVSMNTDTLHYPVDNDQNVTILQKNETVAHADGVPDNIVTEVELAAKDLGAYGIVTNQLMADANFDILGFLTPKFASALSRKIDTAILNDTGTTTGFDCLVTGASLNDSTGSLDVAHILDAYKYLDERMELGAKLFFHRIVYYGTVLNTQDKNDRHVFEHSSSVQKKNIWDIPVVLASALPYALTPGDLVGLLGNMRQAYIIGQRQGAGSFFINPYSLDLERQTRITVNSRWAGKNGFEKAMTRLIY